MRRLILFPCGGETLAATLDEAPGTTGLLIVSGGNEVRMGAHRGMTELAADLASGGTPVFRYDRRGIGDSTGENHGYLSADDDLAAAAVAFRAAAPQVTRMVGFGNCDAATTLALFGQAAGLDALVLANPWVVEEADDSLPPAAAIRSRYAARLKDPREWQRLLTGGVNLRKLGRGLRKIAAAPPPSPGLPARFADALGWCPATIVLAEGDATAIAFTDATRNLDLPATEQRIATASHSFASAEDRAALREILAEALR
ncbi:hydrolase 1, exosortase A system-associated [Sphingomonas aracearum]|uniref:Hydrolase 1, exosortase A system-associated n=1 Tax=Sphingomonas aracearum TaxID=2283317 RepID=A0A369VW15_9SPHN|nr:hydrolase 1, exosortase A system-associated [Sphingomonas aracearum]RDE06586.1 hydrolase 1, exosortase A system-associated [Sphingomonas aracearum]